MLEKLLSVGVMIVFSSRFDRRRAGIFERGRHPIGVCDAEDISMQSDASSWWNFRSHVTRVSAKRSSPSRHVAALRPEEWAIHYQTLGHCFGVCPTNKNRQQGSKKPLITGSTKLNDNDHPPHSFVEAHLTLAPLLKTMGSCRLK